MSRVIATVQIDAPPAAVWKVVMNPDRYADWVTIHRKLGKRDDGQPREGYKLDQTLSLHGAHFRVHWTLTELQEGRFVRWEGRGPAHSYAKTEQRVSAADGGTRLDYLNEFKPPGGPLGAVAGRVLMHGLSEREANASLGQLKRLVEGESHT